MERLSQKIYNARLLTLADYMEDVPSDRFDMGLFLRSNGYGLPRAGDGNTWITREIACGMTACLGGHACMVPEFKRLGLKLVGGFPTITVRGHKYNGFAAMEEVFGTIDLFAPNSVGDLWEDRTNIKKAIKMIRQYVRNHS